MMGYSKFIPSRSQVSTLESQSLRSSVEPRSHETLAPSEAQNSSFWDSDLVCTKTAGEKLLKVERFCVVETTCNKEGQCTALDEKIILGGEIW